MSTPDAYELSAAYMNGLVQAAKKGGFLEAVLATMTEEERASYRQPARQPWWDARYAEAFAARVGSVFGAWAVETVGHEVVADVIGPLIEAQIEAAIKDGQGPEALFAQLDSLARAAVRPLKVEWTQTAPGEGRLELLYPRALEPETELLWRGAIRYAFERTHKSGAIGSSGQPSPGRLVYQLKWS